MLCKTLNKLLNLGGSGIIEKIPNRLVRDVDFSKGSPTEDPQGARHRIHFGETLIVHRKDDVVFIVPNAKSKRKQLIYARQFRSIYKLNTAINEAIEQSAQPTKESPIRYKCWDSLQTIAFLILCRCRTYSCN